ncbi:hypothetical protein [Streptomyces canus]|uniref:hypothetical protein n=1 Tax=Streptomyces canus TaxID=58343 RepID=UPI0027D82E3C|nr:hypothetical protein [Streptomyces canus]
MADGRVTDRVRLSTSRVSTLVRAAERRAGTLLFAHSSRMVRLTRQGTRLYAGLRSAYIQIEHTLEDFRCAGSVGGGVLRAGFSTTVTEKPRLEPIGAFESRYPDCRVVASGMPTPGLFRRAGQGVARRRLRHLDAHGRPADRTPDVPRRGDPPGAPGRHIGGKARRIGRFAPGRTAGGSGMPGGRSAHAARWMLLAQDALHGSGGESLPRP